MEGVLFLNKGLELESKPEKAMSNVLMVFEIKIHLLVSGTLL
jgi:hypothetical protein